MSILNCNKNQIRELIQEAYDRDEYFFYIENEIFSFYISYFEGEDREVMMHINNEYETQLKLNEINDEVNNIIYIYDQFIISDDFGYINAIVSEYNNREDFNDVIKDMKLDDIVNVYLQIILCLNSINQTYEYIHGSLYLYHIGVGFFEEEKTLIYEVLINGNLTEIKLQTLFDVKIDFNNRILYDNFKPEHDIYKFTKYVHCYLNKTGFKNVNIFKDIIDYIKLGHSYDNILFYIISKTNHINIYNNVESLLLYKLLETSF
uniref:Protein kinase n=1 Tax=Pithovirus LCDPAC02 TaxID=2506601 RepID=A0A481YQX2_9VIRU|nr:MAG: hypothetical protein LCDPAC02_00630 [Pithovirus LCDPAC02]